MTRASREAFSCSIGSGREPRLSDTARGGYLSQGSAEAGPIFHMRHHARLLSERCRILPIGHGNHQRQRVVRWHVGVSWVISVISVIAVIAAIAVISDAIDLQAPSSLQAARCTTCFTRPTPSSRRQLKPRGWWPWAVCYNRALPDWKSQDRVVPLIGQMMELFVLRNGGFSDFSPQTSPDTPLF